MITRRTEAEELDARDSLGRFRERFYTPPGQIYLDGNSLGLLSRDAETTTLRVLADWKMRGIGGWLEAELPWFTMAETLAARVAKLVGAQPDEVAIANSTTVNLHQLLATLYRPGASRSKILIDAASFPSDRYAIRSHLRLRGANPDTETATWTARTDGFFDEGDFEKAVGDPSVQMAVIPSVVYTTGQLLDVARICRAAREKGVTIGLDLSHSIGVMPHFLDEWDADFAIWGHYKYVSAGPGAAAGLFINRRHFAEGGGIEAGLAGWWSGHKERMFDMSANLFPGCGASGLQIGTPPMLSMAPIGGALDMLEAAGLEAIRAKSLQLTDFLWRLIEAELLALQFTIGTPREHSRRGGHVALLHEDAGALCAALREAGVVPDFRKPNIVRLAPSPLYNTFTECWEAVRILQKIAQSQSHRKHMSVGALVT